MKEPFFINVTEEIVRGLVLYFLRGPEYPTFCKCHKCEQDVAAIALNALPPRYVTSFESRNKAFKELNTPEMNEVINKAIIHAIHQVGKYPRH